jgi:hypothetical protein
MFGSIDRLTDRVIRRLISFVVAACLGLAAFGVALAALYYWLILWMTAPAALVIVSLILAIAALALARIGMGGSKAAKAVPAAGLPTDMMPGLMAAASNIAGDAVRADPLGAMLGAGAAGFILETRPDLDHALIQQVLRQFLARS